MSKALKVVNTIYKRAEVKVYLVDKLQLSNLGDLSKEDWKRVAIEKQLLI